MSSSRQHGEHLSSNTNHTTQSDYSSSSSSRRSTRKKTPRIWRGYVSSSSTAKKKRRRTPTESIRQKRAQRVQECRKRQRLQYDQSMFGGNNNESDDDDDASDDDGSIVSAPHLSQQRQPPVQQHINSSSSNNNNNSAPTTTTTTSEVRLAYEEDILQMFTKNNPKYNSKFCDNQSILLLQHMSLHAMGLEQNKKGDQDYQDLVNIFRFLVGSASPNNTNNAVGNKNNKHPGVGSSGGSGGNNNSVGVDKGIGLKDTAINSNGCRIDIIAASCHFADKINTYLRTRNDDFVIKATDITNYISIFNPGFNFMKDRALHRIHLLAEDLFDKVRCQPIDPDTGATIVSKEKRDIEYIKLIDKLTNTILKIK